MAKIQINVRVTAEALQLLYKLTDHYSARQADSGRRATQAEVIERALRSLARKEKIGKKIDNV